MDLCGQVAYSELVFLHKTWPEVTSTDLDEILDDYARRHRRYGT
jgi:undecaprenyl diphosphate synthase